MCGFFRFKPKILIQKPKALCALCASESYKPMASFTQPQQHTKKFSASNCIVYQGTDPSKEYANYAYSFFILGYVVA